MRAKGAGNCLCGRLSAPLAAVILEDLNAKELALPPLLQYLEHAIDGIAGSYAREYMHASRQEIGVVEHPAAQMRRTRTKRRGGMPMAAPSGMSATTVADGLRITAEKKKSTSPKRSGVDSAMVLKSDTNWS